MSNRLADSTSPYLLQHADNPVDWHEWGPDAFEEAKRRDVPVFLSVGYSACHWCHVMAHESFEDAEVAALMNERFVNVKVDREERPDVDAIYMDAVTALTGRGGWPMSVFLDPSDARPFYGGTYWPHPGRPGMPGFTQIIDAVTDAWTNRRDEVADTADKIVDHIAQRAAPSAATDLDPGLSDEVSAILLQRAWDRQLGGFGRAPKFPQAMLIEWLLDRHARTGDQDTLLAAGQALDAMARGGINDHLAGGFARYSTDARWLAPHFEKMLYDNALLLPAYAKAASLTADERFLRTAFATGDFLIREFRTEDGGFISATDADSEGVEGKFFVWSDEEFREVVTASGHDADLFAAYFGVTEAGNWEHTNILHEPVDRDAFATEHELDPQAFRIQLAEVTAALLERRVTRVHPGRDDKILTSWNALAIRGFARTGALLARPEYVDVAVATAEFIEANLVVDGVLHHTWKGGTAKVPAFLEDIANLATGYLELFAVTGTTRWFHRAVDLAEDALARFADAEHGGFFQTPHDGEELYRRPKETWDNATPSGNSMMADVARQLAAYTGERRWEDLAHAQLRLFQEEARTSVTGFGWYLQVAEAVAAGPREVAIVGPAGEERDELAWTYWSRPRPGAVIAIADAADDTVPLLAGRDAVDGAPAAYVCERFVCQRPVTDADELTASLR